MLFRMDGAVGGDDSNTQSTGERMVQASFETLSLHHNRTGCLWNLQNNIAF